jgi:hypothetical protein
MSSKVMALLLAACGAFAQAPDAFTGTWKLNVAKSTFTEAISTYRSGTRTYQPVAGGTRVTFDMIHSDGEKVTGDYTAQCQNGKCVSSHASWTQKGARAVEGQTFDGNGKPDNRYVRTVSADGKTMTTTFYPPAGKKKMVAVQIWERQ